MNAIRYTLYSIRYTRYPILKLALITMLICELSTVNCELIYGQTEKVEVDGDLEIQSTESSTPSVVPLRHGLIFKPLTSETTPAAPPPPGVVGQIYYNGDEQVFKYHNNTDWVDLGAGSAAQNKYVATRIVAAWNSFGSTVDGSAPEYDGEGNCTNCCVSDGNPCINPKADTGYTCDGLNDQETINAAITEVGDRGGGAVYLLEGNYNLGAVGGGFGGIQITITESNVALIGAGANTILNASIPMYAIYSSGNKILISQLTISAASGSGGIWLFGWESKIDNVWFKNRSLLRLEGSRNTITNCDFEITEAVMYAINLLGSGNRIYNNSFTGTVGSIFVTGATNSIVGNNFQVGGITVFDKSANSNIIQYNIFSKPAGTMAGICVSADKFKTDPGPTNNIIASNNFNSAWSCSGGNVFDSCLASGSISLCSAESNIVSNNLMYIGSINLGITEATSYYTQNNLISGNLIYFVSGSRSIGFKGNAKNNLLSFNHIANPAKQGTGIEGLSADAGDTYVFGNYIDHYTVNTPISGASNSGTKYTQREKLTLERSSTIFEVGDPPNDVISVPYTTSYIRVKSTGGGKEAKLSGRPGQIVILEGISDTDYVYIENIGGIFGQRFLKKNDVLKVFFAPVSGSDGSIRELGYSDNDNTP